MASIGDPASGFTMLTVTVLLVHRLHSSTDSHNNDNGRYSTLSNHISLSMLPALEVSKAVGPHTGCPTAIRTLPSSAGPQLAAFSSLTSRRSMARPRRPMITYWVPRLRQGQRCSHSLRLLPHFRSHWRRRLHCSRIDCRIQRNRRFQHPSRLSLFTSSSLALMRSVSTISNVFRASIRHSLFILPILRLPHPLSLFFAQSSPVLRVLSVF
ncbi:hypothetical protein FPV67DRAFT_274663 [Lyophyllum atratum]|nr:hypothetical protein FPV67DRAFT_274663 [Lyophyllum atratum]